MKNIKKVMLLLQLLVLAIACGYLIHGEKSYAASLKVNPYIKFSEKWNAFTTNAGDKSWVHYEKEDTVTINNFSTLRALVVGEHYYKAPKEGSIPIKKWAVKWSNAQCIHNAYPDIDQNYLDNTFGRSKCEAFYYSGWKAYCADCHDEVVNMFFYMNKTTAASITELDTSLDYYYLCPFCTNLEQGSPIGTHMCNAISWNRYKVIYDRNGGKGEMEDSIHYYNNATNYNGEEVTPNTRLNKNNIYRTGYIFLGWSRTPNSIKEEFTDGAEIFNLTSKNYEDERSTEGIVTLYAVWKKAESNLLINPNGGTYNKSCSNITLKKKYGETYYVDPGLLTPPKGYIITFYEDGEKGKLAKLSTPNSFIESVMVFSGEWAQSVPFHGDFYNNTYLYRGDDGITDTLTATYKSENIILPTATKPGFSFAGWYTDTSCISYVGRGGDSYTPSGDTKLYAKFVSLLLKAENNYLPYGGAGAVDLSWSQVDGKVKNYRLYQKIEGGTWKSIYGVTDVTDEKSVSLSLSYTGSIGTYEVPYTGMYSFSAYGAQGGNYSTYSGGLGGKIEASIWLTKGEKLTYIIGGQNGYNGGGSATTYAKGGGYTIISSNLKDVLFIAGGGGGASSMGSGGAGGLSTSVISGNVGQSGGAGGGGGASGGSAGELIVHNHSGNTSVSGGCYTKFVAGHTHSSTCYTTTYTTPDSGWGNCGLCGCSSNYSKDGSTCPSCGLYPCYPSRQASTSLTCKITESKGSYTLACGYAGGQVLSSRPAYGGSSMVSNYASTSKMTPGVKAYNGSIAMTSEGIGYLENLSLQAVQAIDYAPPNPIYGISKEVIKGNATQVIVSWKEPMDNGTTYYHKAESYEQKELLLTSNETVNTLVSGIRGYYYLIDSSPETVVTSATKGITYLDKRINKLQVTLTEQVQYLHIISVDVAGNVSNTEHVRFNYKDDPIPWSLSTDNIHVSSTKDSIYQKDSRTYYVRCDGETAFRLSFTSKMHGQASVGYQINHTTFNASVAGTETKQIYDTYTKNASPLTTSEVVTKAQNLEKYVTGDIILQDAAYTITTRSNTCKDIKIEKAFILTETYQGKPISVIPICGADYKDTVVYSDMADDTNHGITLIGDGEAPTFRGTAGLTVLNRINRKDGAVTLSLSAKDDLSGVRDFYVEISNQDNYSKKTYTPNASGAVIMDITEDEPIFSGDFTVTLYAVDNVGNERIETYGTTEFSLEASITRKLAPYEPVFKAGESGVLTVVTYGYAEKLVITFPQAFQDAFSELQREYIYEFPRYMDKVEIEFRVPLYIKDEVYTIKVQAFKGNKKLEECPSFGTFTVNGSVLDEIRTRAR